MRSFGLLVRLTIQWLAPNQPNLNRLSLRRLLFFGLFLLIFLPLQAVNRMAMLADRLFFDFRLIEPREPVFLVGVPRSGTTFLHRLLALNTDQLTTMRLWELLFAPSILQKRLVLFLARIDRGIGRIGGRSLAVIEKRLFGSLDSIHGTSLASPEEDYLTLLPDASCFLLILAFPFSKEIWQLAYFQDQVSADRQQSILKFYRGAVQRHLHVFGRDKRLLSKNPSFTPWVEPLRKEFTGARFVGCVRVPDQAIPSLLSSMESGASLLGNSNNKDFQSAQVRMVKQYYELLLKQYGSLPEYTQLRFEDLVRDPYDCAMRVCGHLNLDRFDNFDEKLKNACQAAANYSSRHQYSLKEFDLNLESIRREFGFVYEALEHPSVQAN